VSGRFKIEPSGADDVRVTPDRCPACAALVPARSSWCTLCFADLRGPATTGFAPVPESAPVGVAPGSDPVPASGSVPRSRGRHARRTPATVVIEPPAPVDAGLPIAADVDLDDLDMTLLRAGQPPDPLGAWSSRLASPGARIGLIVGGIAAVGGALLLLFTLAGLVLG
jgi:hypothetical protein